MGHIIYRVWSCRFVFLPKVCDITGEKIRAFSFAREKRTAYSKADGTPEIEIKWVSNNAYLIEVLKGNTKPI